MYNVEVFLEQDDWLAHLVELPNVSAFGVAPEKVPGGLDIALRLVKELYAVRAIEILSGIGSLAKEGALAGC